MNILVVFTKKSRMIIHLLPTTQMYLSSINITNVMVLCKLRVLNPGKSTGPNGWHPYFLSRAKNKLALFPEDRVAKKRFDPGSHNNFFFAHKWISK